ncbi:hypothetical protein [Rhodopirellula halodulae]|uniref:hypothetical protein n=1 Tax=Rhodopirellula halodulae TaxID=2894198 RepID=UPI001E3F6D4C|nr:hypothetical protein [Rhodopirellula sp. JC737]MCC9654577.1 hypothetical protein [Rhodopirellula sp. JC737]
MSAVFGSLQFDNDQVCVSVNSQQVDPPTRIIPLPKLFTDNQGVGRDYVNLFPQQTLKVSSLSDPHIAKGSLGDLAYFVIAKLKDRHTDLTVRKLALRLEDYDYIRTNFCLWADSRTPES